MRAVKRKRKAKVSLGPQTINSETWYYENESSIEIISYERQDGRWANIRRFRIPSRKLLASLKRQGYLPALGAQSDSPQTK